MNWMHTHPSKWILPVTDSDRERIYTTSTALHNIRAQSCNMIHARYLSILFQTLLLYPLASSHSFCAFMLALLPPTVSLPLGCAYGMLSRCLHVVEAMNNLPVSSGLTTTVQPTSSPCSITMACVVSQDTLWFHE